MSPMRRTNPKGHALRGEGKAYMPGDPEEEQDPWIRVKGHIGRGLCECGEVSPVTWTDVSRKLWHARHKEKEEVLKHMDELEARDDHA